MVISFCPTFLPSLGDAAEQDPAAAQDTGTPLFDGLMADPRFEDLRLLLDGPPPGQPPIQDEAARPARGNHPVATVLSNAPDVLNAPDDERDIETTMVFPAIDTDTHELPAVKLDTWEPQEPQEPELWRADVGGPAHPRTRA